MSTWWCASFSRCSCSSPSGPRARAPLRRTISSSCRRLEPRDGRTVAAELADFDGDGRSDLLQVVFAGVPPHETRRLRLWRQGEDGRLPSEPSYEIPVPEHSAAYDVGDVLELPGTELVLLRPNGLTILSFSNPGLPSRDLEVDGSTLVPSEDERGLDRLRMIYRDFGPEPRLLVPMLAETIFLRRTASGVRCSMRARARTISCRRGPGRCSSTATSSSCSTCRESRWATWTAMARPTW